MKLTPKYELTGKIFNNWKVLKLNTNKKRSHDRYWLCECKCGRTSSVPTCYLTKGYSKQCGYCARHKKDIYPDGLPDQVWNRIKTGATKRNLKLNISKKLAYEIFIKQGKKCNLTGMDIRFPAYGTDKEWTASLDRIDSNKDYTANNIQWIHKDVNRIKNIFDEKYFVSICKKVVLFCKDRYNESEVLLNDRRKYYNKKL